MSAESIQTNWSSGAQTTVLFQKRKRELAVTQSYDDDYDDEEEVCDEISSFTQSTSELYKQYQREKKHKTQQIFQSTKHKSSLGSNNKTKSKKKQKSSVRKNNKTNSTKTKKSNLKNKKYVQQTKKKKKNAKNKSSSKRKKASLKLQNKQNDTVPTAAVLLEPSSLMRSNIKQMPSSQPLILPKNANQLIDSYSDNSDNDIRHIHTEYSGHESDDDEQTAKHPYPMTTLYAKYMQIEQNKQHNDCRLDNSDINLSQRIIDNNNNNDNKNKKRVCFNVARNIINNNNNNKNKMDVININEDGSRNDDDNHNNDNKNKMNVVNINEDSSSNDDDNDDIDKEQKIAIGKKRKRQQFESLSNIINKKNPFNLRNITAIKLEHNSYKTIFKKFNTKTDIGFNIHYAGCIQIVFTRQRYIDPERQMQINVYQSLMGTDRSVPITLKTNFSIKTRTITHWKCFKELQQKLNATKIVEKLYTALKKKQYTVCQQIIDNNKQTVTDAVDEWIICCHNSDWKTKNKKPSPKKRKLLS